MNRCLFLALLLAALPAQAESYMVGTWFGYGQPGENNAMYIDRMRPDGSWRGEYRTCIKGKPLDSAQEGRWRLSGDHLLLDVETVDGKKATRADSYRMLEHDMNRQKYLILPSNFAYTPRRVPDDFQMPDCGLVS